MFARNEDAGPAGNVQWGLDKGMLENNWDPWDENSPQNEIGYQRRVESDIETTEVFRVSTRIDNGLRYTLGIHYFVVYS
ncbi:hypothetical protein K435DRAFT_881621 [Dendrothele bispora CBS 962.96]|uniref:Uncharacterized protein n=1 Tax=Dendrothele bispora (strain CBS 962.96) TaxID=1314807 RepID=A0A4S8KI97_DENBC|nr:hypothetical protein K435DRAFT_881621 [Dendrothele bispora CBS 962.96]